MKPPPVTWARRLALAPLFVWCALLGAAPPASTASGSGPAAKFEPVRSDFPVPESQGAPVRSTSVSIVDGRWHLNGKVTYPGAKAEGLLMNVRMVNAVFEDGNDTTRPQGFDPEANLIALVRKTAPRLLVSTAGMGSGTLPDEVALASDFLLIHFNNTELADVPERIAALKKYGKPIVCNEDDKVGADGATAAERSVADGASWGFMHSRVNQYFPLQFNGTKDDPAVYLTLRRLTTATANERNLPERVYFRPMRVAAGAR